MNKTTKDTIADALVVIAMLVAFISLAWVSTQSSMAPISSVQRLADHSHMLVFTMKHEASGATGSSSCTATAIGKRTVLTATHCISFPAGVSLESITLDGKLLEVESEHNDGADHLILVFTEEVFSSWSKLEHRALIEGEDLLMWGYPASIDRQRRKLMVSGTDSATSSTLGANAWLLDGMVYRGDSGAALYDRKGRMVGMISYIRVAGGEKITDGRLQFGGALEFKFTKEQIEAIR